MGVEQIMTQSFLQQGSVPGLSHPVGVTLLGLVSAQARVSCNLSLLIKLRMDTTCTESLTDALSLYMFIFLFVTFALRYFFSYVRLVLFPHSAPL